MRDGSIACLAFTERGRALANRICGALGGEASCTRDGVGLRDWTAAHFPTARALIYVGAAGIAVRAVAPHLVGKTGDPAVLCVDEGGRYTIPLASGHLGGANALARQIADAIGAEAVVTTATDTRGVFSVDEWARVQGLAVVHPERIKTVSAALLNGETVTLRAAYPIDGEVPEGVELTKAEDADVWLDVRPHDALTVVPRCLTLGVGCKRGTSRETLERRFDALCAANGVLPEAINAAATIDLKRGEAGLLDFCAAHGWKLATFSADELAAVEGGFSASSFVQGVTGVDNVCERAAVKASQGKLLVRKCAGDGVTFALAEEPARLDWRWRDG